MPGKERGKVILQNLLKALSPKSAAASSKDLSIFSKDTYMGNIANADHACAKVTNTANGL